MNKTAVLATVLAAISLAALCPSRARAWDGQTHKLSGKMLIDYMPPTLKTSVKKYQSQYYEGIDKEPELYNAHVEKNGSFNQKVFTQTGLERLLYHMQRIQSYLSQSNTGDVLAFETGQFVRCAADLFEPLPENTRFSPVEISGSRIFFLADFAKNNPKFDFMYRGGRNIQNFPAAVDALIKLNAASGAAIYNAYHTKRYYPSVDKEATASFNRSLSFIVDSLKTLDTLVRQPGGRILDLRNLLGLNRISKYNNDNEMKIKKPAAPAKPKAPGVSKPDAPDAKDKNGKNND